MTQQTDTAYSFDLEYLTDGGARHCGREALQQPHHFARAVYATALEGVAKGVFPAYQPVLERSQIDPVFSSESNALARSVGFRCSVWDEQSKRHTKTFDIHYFSAQASRRRAVLRSEGRLGAEDQLLFQLSAYLEDQAPLPKAQSQIEMGSDTVCLELEESRREDFGASESWDAPNGSDLPVLIARSVLEDAVEEARAAPEREIAGLLLGHVYHDPGRSEVFVLVSGLASAEGTTEASATSVTLTGESFQQAREMIALRGRAESVVGWMHSHPMRFCEACPLPTPPECIQKILFFSSDDTQLHETTFPQPFHVGLLAAVEPRLDTVLGHLPVRLFGWQDGVLDKRGFGVVDL